jgi:hypothetical protein
MFNWIQTLIDYIKFKRYINKRKSEDNDPFIYK